MEKKKLIILLAVLGILITALVFGLITFMNKSNKQGEQIAQTEMFMEEEKQQMVTEIDAIAGEMDGYTMYVHNDSLLREFDLQKQRIKDLQNELKQTKATDAKRIAELKNEIASLRKILAHYIQQIDSLNTANKRLTNENLEVKERIQSVSATAEMLAKEKESLSEVVTRAAVLELYNFSFNPLDGRNKKTDRASKMTNLKFNFTIGKNITAEPGPKTVYLRVTRPDSEVMQKGNTVFSYENKNITYTIHENPIAIDEVLINAKKKTFKIENGNLTIDVANSIFNKSTNPTDLFSKLPSVMLGADRESLTIIGKGNPLLYIGNQKVDFNAINTLSVDDIKSIEIIKNGDLGSNFFGFGVTSCERCGQFVCIDVHV